VCTIVNCSVRCCPEFVAVHLESGLGRVPRREVGYQWVQLRSGLSLVEYINQGETEMYMNLVQ
jgi:hypothetical protein